VEGRAKAVRDRTESQEGRMDWLTLPKRDIVELKEQSDALLSNAWLTMQSDERLSLLRHFSVGYWVPPSLWRPLTTYRAQENTDGEPFSNVNRLLAPPAHCVSTNGRLNRAGKPTLYLAATPFSALKEIEAKPGCMATILAARIRPDARPFSLAPVAMSAHQGSARIGKYEQRFSQGALSHPQFAARLDELGCVEQWLMQQTVVSHLLTLRLPHQHEHILYELTNELKDMLFSCGFPYEGVEYPSVADGRASPNIALNRDRWGDIEPLEVWVVEVGPDLWPTSTGMLIGTKPLIWRGTIIEGGAIRYERTEKSLLAATADLKQKHGISVMRVESGLQPILSRGYTRHRICFDNDRGKSNMDFVPPGSGRIYWTPE
jgi:hypothetical protein